MTHVLITTTDGNIYSLEELSATQAESLAMFLAITDSLTWQEAVIDIANWTARFSHTLAKELPGLLPGVIRSRHGGKVPGVKRETMAGTSVRQSIGAGVTLTRRDKDGVDWFDLLVKAEGRK